MRKEEFERLGRLMVDVYSKLDGFPSQEEQPAYYEMLANMGKFSEKKTQKYLSQFQLKASWSAALSILAIWRNTVQVELRRL